MTTDIIETTESDVESTSTAEMDPVEAFVQASTEESRKLRLDEIPALYDGAVAALKERYGDFTPEVAESAPDVLERFIMFADMANRGWTKSLDMDKLRADRRTAIQILLYVYKWRKIKIVRWMGAKERRVIDFATGVGDKTKLPNWSEKRAADAAKSKHAEYMIRNNYGLAARPERDRILLELAEGRWDGNYRLTDAEMEAARRAAAESVTPKRPLGRVWSNAELARLAKMSTAAVAQLRTGTAPSSRRAAANTPVAA